MLFALIFWISLIAYLMVAAWKYLPSGDDQLDEKRFPTQMHF